MKSIAIKLAIFTVFTVSMTYLLASVIGNFNPLQGRYELEAVFEDATGLLKGDQVTLAGVTVGKVKKAEVNKGLAIVKLLIEDYVKLPRTTKIEIRYRNLIGQRVVELEPGSGRAPFFKDGDRVPVTQTEGPLDLDTVFNNLRPLVTGFSADDLNTLSETLVVSLAGRKDDVDALLANTADLTGRLAAKGTKIADLVSNINTVATTLADERDQLQKLLFNFAKLTGVLADNSGELERVLTNLDIATGELGRLLESNRPSLDRDLKDVAVLLDIVVKHQSDLAQLAANLDDVLRATARATTYGEWANLFVFSLCPSTSPGCLAPTSSTASLTGTRRGGSIRSFMYSSLGAKQ